VTHQISGRSIGNAVSARWNAIAFNHSVIMFSVRSRHVLPVALAAAIISQHPCLAQSATAKPVPDGSRAQLVAQARAADSLGRKEEAFLIRARLKNGDFDVGDRVFISYEGAAFTRRDTLVVQGKKILPLSDPLGDLDLNGVLRSELADSVTARVERYFKNEVVHVTALLRLSVSGAVRSPGFYYVPSDLPLGDLIMRTGGQDPTADLRNVTIRRGTQILWSSPDVQAALGDGLTLNGLNLQPGDEVVVGAKATRNWTGILQIGLPVLGIIIALLTRPK
jgi:protein involved in polysaccharide export with SLBB domain